MCQDEKRFAILAAEDKLQRALGDVDLGDLLSSRRIDEYLAVGNVDIALRIGGYAFAAAVHKRLEIGERAVGVNGGAVRDVFGLAADKDVLAWLCFQKPIGVEVVAETPARGVAGGPLLEDTACGQNGAAVGRDVRARFGRGHVGREHFAERRESHGAEFQLVLELAVVPVIRRENESRVRVCTSGLRLEDG